MKKYLIMNKLFGDQNNNKKQSKSSPARSLARGSHITNLLALLTFKTKDRMLWLINLTG